MKEISVLIVGAGSYSKTTPSIRGIGTATAELFADRGYRIGFTYNTSAEGADRLTREIEKRSRLKPRCMQFDALRYETEWNKIEVLIDELGLPEVVVYSAGIRFWKKELDQRELHETFVVNYECPRFLTNVIIERMRSRNNGRIILVSSVLAGRKHPYLQAYCNAKGELDKFAEEKNKELKKHGVAVVSVRPVLTRTPLTEERLEAYEKAAEEGKLPKMAEPEEIAEVILSISEADSVPDEHVYAPLECRAWLEFYKRGDWNCNTFN